MRTYARHTHAHTHYGKAHPQMTVLTNLNTCANTGTLMHTSGEDMVDPEGHQHIEVVRSIETGGSSRDRWGSRTEFLMATVGT